MDLLEQLETMFGNVPEKGTYHVQLKDEDGKYLQDWYKDYERGRRVIPMVKKE